MRPDTAKRLKVVVVVLATIGVVVLLSVFSAPGVAALLVIAAAVALIVLIRRKFRPKHDPIWEKQDPALPKSMESFVASAGKLWLLMFLLPILLGILLILPILVSGGAVL